MVTSTIDTSSEDFYHATHEDIDQSSDVDRNAVHRMGLNVSDQFQCRVIRPCVDGQDVTIDNATQIKLDTSEKAKPRFTIKLLIWQVYICDRKLYRVSCCSISETLLQLFDLCKVLDGHRLHDG